MKLLTRYRRKPEPEQPKRETVPRCSVCHEPRPDPWWPCDYCGDIAD